MEPYLSASQVCAAAHCPASTLRAWRNRNGLFSERHSIGDGWTQFDFAEAIGVRLVVLLTQRGFAAQPAINLVNSMRKELERAAKGYAPWVGVAFKEGEEILEFRELNMNGTVLDQLGWFTDSIVTAINLRHVSNEIFWLIRLDKSEKA